jgi:hypothetical protein
MRPGSNLSNTELPLVLLDFDGVFNALAILMDMSEWQDGGIHSACMPSGTHGFSYSPSVAQFFAERASLAEFVWLSTWEEETPIYGTAMGLPEFSWLGTDGMDQEPSAPWWKFQVVQQLAAQFPGRRILWIDDEIPADIADPIRVWLNRNPQVEFIRPDDFHGLKSQDLGEIEEFLRK